MKHYIITFLVYIFLSGIIISTYLINEDLTIVIYIVLGMFLICFVSDKITKWLTKK